jgi:porin
MFRKDTGIALRMDLHYDAEDRLMWKERERRNGSTRALSRLASNTMLCVALGGILAVAKQTPAQSPQQQFLAGSEKREGVSWDMGKEPVATTISSLDPTDLPIGKGEATSKGETSSWGPVTTHKSSLANLAPVLLPYFNNGPVFGLPGTVTGDFWERTQFSGDLGGVRTDLARHGLFFDLYSTSTYQDVASGGLKTGSSFIQNTQLSINLDTGRAGLWSGGLFHLTLESRNGSSSPQSTFTAGSSVPQYAGLAFPGPFFVHDVLPTEYFLLQSLAPKFSMLLGKINVVTVCDQTLFGNRYKFDFANLNLNKNPMALNFYNTTSLSAVGVWTPSPKVVVAAGVFDPNSQANNLAAKAFDKVNVYGTGIFSYNIGNLPGQSWAQFNWTNKPKIDLGAPFGQLAPGMNSQAIGILLGSPSLPGVPINYNSDSWVTLGNISQYLFVKDPSEAIAGKLASGQPLRGIGVLGRLGYAPEQTNTITRDASVALFAHGLFDFRKNDSLGTGFYHNGISEPLKLDIEQLSGSKNAVRNENGSEIFYDFAITPAVRFIPSYQHIWNPLTAEATRNQRAADMFYARLTVVW